MTLLDDPTALSGKITGAGSVLVVANTAQVSLLPLVYKLKGAGVQIADKAFDADGKHYPAGSLLITGADDATITPILHDLSLDAAHLTAAPSVPSHAATAPRVAFMHTWLATQTEGWWRYAFDTAGVPYDYISTQTRPAKRTCARNTTSSSSRRWGAQAHRTSSTAFPCGTMPCPGRSPIWTPNLGRIDSTADIRPGLGYEGLEHLRHFVEQGGLLITCEDTAQFAVDTGLAPGVTVVPRGDARVVGNRPQHRLRRPRQSRGLRFRRGRSGH